MKKKTLQLLPLLLILSVAVILPLHLAHGAPTILGGIASTFIEDGLAWIMNVLISMMSILIAVAGYLLNFSINLTLNIKDFVDSTPAIFTTWKAIRDISGIFIIFFLLYAALQLITGIRKPDFGGLIKNIVMAGVLINFSFFFAGIGIDISNIVSVQLYNAIAPANQWNAGSSIFNGNLSSRLDGGLSDIFMNSLKIQTIYNTPFSPSAAATGGTPAPTQAQAASPTVASALSGSIKIILLGIVALIIEFVAAMSFAAAALAFIFRFVILIFLLAFSPIWFISFLSPQLKEYAGKWSKMYQNMLLFMPVYLLLMYLALNVLTTSPMFGNSPGTVTATAGTSPVSALMGTALAQTSLAGNVGDGAWYSGILVLGINAAIVIVLLNLPLLAAASIAGKAIPLLEGAINKFGAGKVWARTGSRTLGRAAYSVNNSGVVARMSQRPIVGKVLNSTLSSVSKSNFGGDKKDNYEDILKAKNKSSEELHKKIGTVDRSKYKTDAAYKEEQEKRKKYQTGYRENLPWKAGILNPGLPGTSGIIGFMVDNRSNRTTEAKLKKEAGESEKKEKKKEAEKNKNILKKELARINTEIEESGDGIRADGPEGDNRALREKLFKLRERKKEIEETLEDLDAQIAEGNAAEAEEKDKKQASSFDEIKGKLDKE